MAGAFFPGPQSLLLSLSYRSLAASPRRDMLASKYEVRCQCFVLSACPPAFYSTGGCQPRLCAMHVYTMCSALCF
ncbi:hypothetical protein B0O99DRAFT_617224 [Bisporella sp. PMI_857]|nr:hypothetical protein B0O99DRAFT_617224 [Bisporella sp. PMI_857]